MSARNGTADAPLYVFCRSASRGNQACDNFLTAGLTNGINVEGGTPAL